MAERDGCPNNLRVPCGSVSAQSYTERKPNFDSRNLEESRGSVLWVFLRRLIIPRGFTHESCPEILSRHSSRFPKLHTHGSRHNFVQMVRSSPPEPLPLQSVLPLWTPRPVSDTWGWLEDQASLYLLLVPQSLEHSPSFVLSDLLVNDWGHH